MSEIDLDDAVTTPEPETTPAEEQTPEAKTFTQEDVDRIVQERITRERAKYSEFDNYRHRAGQYDEVVARAESAERELAETRHSVLKARIAAEYGVPETVLVGDSEESLRSTAALLTEWRGAPAKTETPATRVINQSGASKTPEVLDAKEKAAQALRRAF